MIQRSILILFLLLNTALGSTLTTQSPSNPQTLFSAQQLTQRIKQFSGQFLGKPYLENPLGEGPDGRYDQTPRSRFDAFDCQTYVETVLALALSHSPKQFKTILDRLRYHGNHIDFLTRNHFITSDWLPSNSAQKYIQDQTIAIAGAQHKTISVVLDQGRWFQTLPIKRVRLKNATPLLIQQRLQELQHLGKLKPRVRTQINYIPLNVLSDVASHIPDGAIIFTVRPLWNAKAAANMPILVSHMGFAIWQHDQLFLRHASLLQQRIVDEPLLPYLNQQNAVKSIGGVSVYVISDGTLVGATGGRPR